MQSAEKKRATVFFSYSWNDKSHRKTIGQELAKRYDIHVKFDQDEDQNQPVRKIIDTIVNEADALIVLISQNSMKSRYVIEELSRCDERGVRFIPVVLEDLDRREIPEFVAEIPPIRFDPRSDAIACAAEINTRLDKIEVRHIWKRRMLQKLHRTAIDICEIDHKPTFIKHIAEAVVGTVEAEVRQLTNEQYSRDISIEQNYVHRAMPLFSEASELFAVSIAGVSTFWTDPATRPAAIRYAASHKGKLAYRLFVFRSPRELNHFKNVLTVNSEMYGDDGGVFVCSLDSYVRLFSQHGRDFLRVGLDSDFGLLSVPMPKGVNAWVKAELDRDNFRFEFLSDTQRLRVEDLFKTVRSWRDLRPGDVNKSGVMRWDRAFASEPDRLASVLYQVFPTRERSVCHLVLFKNVSNETASKVVWPLRHQVGDFELNSRQFSWTGVRVSNSEVLATHGNSTLNLSRNQDFDYLLKVHFESSEQLQQYYREAHHQESRRRLYEGIEPETIPLFEKLDELAATGGENANKEMGEVWDQIELLVQKRLLRIDFKDEEPFGILTLERGFSFGETT